MNSDGGVSFGVDTFTSDVDTTAFWLQFMLAANEAGSTVPTKVARQSALAFLRSEQNLDGGFGYSHGAVSNSASSAVVMQAFNAQQIDLADVRRNLRTPYNFMKSVQTDNGQFAYTTQQSSNYDLLNTAYAVIALNGGALPVLPPQD
jgi:prenyltransferase beta subunit